MITKKFKNIVLAICFSSPFIVLFPKIFICKWYDSLILGATLLGALAAVAAVILVVIFYQDFAANKILDKNIETIGEFLEEVNSMLIDVSIVDSTQKNESDKIVMWTRTWMRKNLNFDESFKINNLDPSKTPLVFNVDNYYSQLKKLDKIASSIYMPKELQGIFNSIRLQSFYGISGDLSGKYVEIFFNKRANREWDNFTGKSELYPNFQDFLGSFQNIIIELEDWLNKHCESGVLSRLNL